MIWEAVNITTATNCPLLQGPLLVEVTGIRFLLVIVGSVVFAIIAEVV